MVKHVRNRVYKVSIENVYKRTITFARSHSQSGMKIIPIEIDPPPPFLSPSVQKSQAVFARRSSPVPFTTMQS